MTLSAVVRELNVFPLKSAGGISVGESQVTPGGLRHDREFMLVRPDRRHLSQREVPRLALLRPSLAGATLIVDALDAVTPLVHEPADGPVLDVTLHGMPCQGVDQGDDAADWFSAYLDTECRLVRFAGVRHTQPGGGGRVTFADGDPLHVLSRESLDDLNQRLSEPLPMDRFRPNIVLEGLGPYGEDAVSALRIGEVEIELIAPCGRCVLTTIDQQTGVQGGEPLRTLATYRTQDFAGRREIMFGRLAIPRTFGMIATQDTATAT
ncbi:MAG TPA: MOSC N-terminal beta barrel domain-containing protein [Streptosporangiaceae bacterium]|jgi:uncharacterized protein YcbX|nr:MOSC N-terminal beta barrel domain-containing protein [Streptosporangiaceae bacterium]